jgi:hypothetical protein
MLALPGKPFPRRSKRAPATHDCCPIRREDVRSRLWLFEEFRVSLEELRVGRELRALGFR